MAAPPPPPPLQLSRQISDLVKSGQLTGLERAVAKELIASGKLSTEIEGVSAPPGGAGAAASTNQQTTKRVKEAVSEVLKREAECETEQLTELDAMKEIFPSSELFVCRSTQPRVLSLKLLMHGLEWGVILSVRLPRLYPFYEPLRVSAYVSHPSITTADGVLSVQLQNRANELCGTAGSGGSSIFAVVEDAREWIATTAIKTIDQLKAAELAAGDDSDTTHMSSSDLRARTRMPWPVLQSMIGLEVIERSQIQTKQTAVINSLISTLAAAPHRITLTPAAAIALLRTNLWDVKTSVAAATASPEAKKKTAAAAADSKQSGTTAAAAAASTSGSARFDCLICIETFELREGVCACGEEGASHWVCTECWLNYLSSQIKDGGCIIRCPGFKCTSVIEEPLIQSSVDHDLFRRYQKWLANSYLMLAGWTECIRAPEQADSKTGCHTLFRYTKKVADVKLPATKKEAAAAKTAAKTTTSAGSGGATDSTETKSSRPAADSKSAPSKNSKSSDTKAAAETEAAEKSAQLNSCVVISCLCGVNHCSEYAKCEASEPHWPATCSDMKRFEPVIKASMERDEKNAKMAAEDKTKAGVNSKTGMADVENCKPCPKCGHLWGKVDGTCTTCCLLPVTMINL